MYFGYNEASKKTIVYQYSKNDKTENNIQNDYLMYQYSIN